MRTFILITSLLGLALPVLSSDTMMTYQGQLQQQGQPFSGELQMVFTLFDQENDGSMVGMPIVKGNVPVSDGLFQVDLDFGHVFQGERWLEIVVDGVELVDRQRIAPAPTAVYALNVPNGVASVWQQDGHAISYWANGQGMGIEPDSDATEGPRIVMGHTGNQAGGAGATVSGGGTQSAPNNAGGDYSTVGGGKGNVTGSGSEGGNTIGGGLNNTTGFNSNTVSGGRDNHAGPNSSTVSGGRENEATGWYATIGGGFENAAPGERSVIGGGQGNQAGDYAVVGGGLSNSATGAGSMIPGGGINEAVGSFSLAAGFRAKANHDGAFVWADSANADFASTGDRQFLVRAAGGVGINTNSPARMLHMRGNTSNTPTMLFESEGAPEDRRIAALFMNVTTGHMSIGRMTDDGASLTSTHLQIRSDDGHVGIGRTGGSIAHPLHMASGAHVTSGGSWTNASDKHSKTAFESVDATAVLQTLVELPLSVWEYKSDPGVRHLGPMAQDFATAFGLGADDSSISTVDASGVALAAIKGLHAELFEERERNDQLEARLADVEAENVRLAGLADRNDELEQRLAALESLLFDERAVASER